MKQLPERSSGILMPLSALPETAGSAYDFADFLADSGQTFWQVLPLCDRDETLSPYRSDRPGSVAEEYRTVLTPRGGDGGGDMKALWRRLRKYCSERSVYIIGDMPFYVSPDSGDVRLYPRLFDTSRSAGVPPDAFSADGQDWAMPVYNWPEHRRDGYAWWRERAKSASELFDVLRIDHFRAFYNWFSRKTDGTDGRWEDGERDALLTAIRESTPEMPLIAEDLGEIEAPCRQWISSTGIPTMSVLTQAFDMPDSSFLPHRSGNKTVLYTSTHDTDTFVGWLSGADAHRRQYASEYLRLRLDEGLGWGALKACFASAARLVIAPLQDVLGLGSDARVNIPGTTDKRNWRWRVSPEALNRTVAGMLRDITALYGR